ncbi:MAG: hypothetical protein AB7G87_11525 [Clostridia bacterium]
MSTGIGGFFGDNSEILFFILIFLLLFFNNGYGGVYGCARSAE